MGSDRLFLREMLQWVTLRVTSCDASLLRIVVALVGSLTRLESLGNRLWIYHISTRRSRWLELNMGSHAFQFSKPCCCCSLAASGPGRFISFDKRDPS